MKNKAGFPEINDDQESIMKFEALTDQDGPVEIIPGMTVEEISAMYVNEGELIQAPYKIWQLNSSGHRYYYRIDENGNPEFYPSVTTILSQTLPQSQFLINWIAEKGIEEADRYKNEKAAYGTFMHGECAKLLINREYDFDALKSSLKAYVEAKRLPDDFIHYADELKKDILSFAQFMVDYDVKPLAVEIALVHPINKYAGMIDCPCSMLDRIGGKERILAIIDLKSGKKGFYEMAEIQLHLYKEMWNANFPKHQIERVFNFSPKDWRIRPTYNLKEQTDSKNAAKIPALLSIASIEDGKKDNIFTSISGTINLDNGKKLIDNVVSLSLSDIIKTRSPKKDKPKAAKKQPSKAASKPKEKKTAAPKDIASKKEPVKQQKQPSTVKKPKKEVVAPDQKESVLKSSKSISKSDLLKSDPEI